jgi:hypothetical protein
VSLFQGFEPCPFFKQIWNLFSGRKEVVTPPPEIAPPTPPTAIREPEMGLGAAVPPEYRQRESLFTYRERAFFKALLEDVGSQYAVFAKVRLADVIWLEPIPKIRMAIMCQEDQSYGTFAETSWSRTQGRTATTTADQHFRSGTR